MICQIDSCSHQDSPSGNSSGSLSSGEEDIYYSTDESGSGRTSSSSSSSGMSGSRRIPFLTEMESRNNSENILRTFGGVRNSPYFSSSEDSLSSSSPSHNHLHSRSVDADVDRMQQVSNESQNDRRSVVSVIEANEQSISVHHEKNSFLCRALQCRWLLFQDKVVGAGGTDDNLYENAYLMLDPELQPISPATDIPESMRIFDEHKKLAQDYIQIQAEIACLIQAKEDLQKQLAEEQQYGPFRDQGRTLKEMRELKSENDSLLQYHTNLKKQLEIIKGKKQRKPTTPSGEVEPEPGWVMVPRRGS